MLRNGCKKAASPQLLWDIFREGAICHHGMYIWYVAPMMPSNSIFSLGRFDRSWWQSGFGKVNRAKTQERLLKSSFEWFFDTMRMLMMMMMMMNSIRHLRLTLSHYPNSDVVTPMYIIWSRFDKVIDVSISRTNYKCICFDFRSFLMMRKNARADREQGKNILKVNWERYEIRGQTIMGHIYGEYFLFKPSNHDQKKQTMWRKACTKNISSLFSPPQLSTPPPPSHSISLLYPSLYTPEPDRLPAQPPRPKIQYE